MITPDQQYLLDCLTRASEIAFWKEFDSPAARLEDTWNDDYPDRAIRHYAEVHGNDGL